MIITILKSQTNVKKFKEKKNKINKQKKKTNVENCHLI